MHLDYIAHAGMVNKLRGHNNFINFLSRVIHISQVETSYRLYKIDNFMY